jgi:tyrosine-protein phosphatase YwqE
MQLNLPSIVGYYGKTAQEKASWLLDKDMYSAIGSDCHKEKAFGEPYSRNLLSKENVRKLKKMILP